MTPKEMKIRQLARKFRRHEKARAQAAQECRNHQFVKNATFEDALKDGITHDELWLEIEEQNKEAEEYES